MIYLVIPLARIVRTRNWSGVNMVGETGENDTEARPRMPSRVRRHTNLVRYLATAPPAPYRAAHPVFRAAECSAPWVLSWGAIRHILSRQCIRYLCSLRSDVEFLVLHCFLTLWSQKSGRRKVTHISMGSTRPAMGVWGPHTQGAQETPQESCVSGWCIQVVYDIASSSQCVLVTAKWFSLRQWKKKQPAALSLFS